MGSSDCGLHFSCSWSIQGKAVAMPGKEVSMQSKLQSNAMQGKAVAMPVRTVSSNAKQCKSMQNQAMQCRAMQIKAVQRKAKQSKGKQTVTCDTYTYIYTTPMLAILSVDFSLIQHQHGNPNKTMFGPGSTPQMFSSDICLI